MKLLRFSKKPIIVWDFETCCLNLLPLKTHKLKNLPWSLGYLIVEGGKIKDKGVRYIWWEDLPIRETAAMMTGFNLYEYQKKAEDPVDVLTWFDSWLYDKEVQNLGHNSFGFDIYLHNILRRECGLQTDWSYLMRSHDTNLLGKAFLKGISIEVETPEDYFIMNQRLMSLREKGLKTGLASLSKQVELDYDSTQHHDALYDVDLTNQILQKLKYSLDVPCLVS